MVGRHPRSASAPLARPPLLTEVLEAVGVVLGYRAVELQVDSKAGQSSTQRAMLPSLPMPPRRLRADSSCVRVAAPRDRVAAMQARC